MATPYTVLRWLFHKLLPASIRELPALQRLSHNIVHRVANHSELYDALYYKDVDELASRSVPTMASSITGSFKPRRIIDVGCGTGALLEALRDAGCSCMGLEYSDAGLAICRSRGLDVRKFDVERSSLSHDLGTFDVAVSMEVAEHLPATCAEPFVELLTSLAPVVVFTAATPGQGGVDHVNLQPHLYWIDLFKSRGFHFQKDLSEEWRSRWEAGGDVVSFYHKNLMIYRRTIPQ
jgi:SAM-dependent methyltransferase